MGQFLLYYAAFKKGYTLYKAYKEGKQGVKKVDGVGGVFKALLSQVETGREQIQIAQVANLDEIDKLVDERNRYEEDVEQADKLIVNLQGLLK